MDTTQNQESPKREYKVVASYADSRKAYGLTSAELEEAMLMYTDHAFAEAMKEIYGVTPEGLDASTREVLHTLFTRGTTVGMKIAARPHIVPEHYQEQKELKPQDLVTTYEFEEGMGVCGILKPDGTFLKCGNGEHHYLTEGVPLEEQFTYIYFSGVRRYRGQADAQEDGDGIITTAPKFGFRQFAGETPEQVAWVFANAKYFDRGQMRAASVMWGVGEDDAVLYRMKDNGSYWVHYPDSKASDRLYNREGGWHDITPEEIEANYERVVIDGKV